MTAERLQRNCIILQVFFLFSLLVLTPYVMTLTASEGIFAHGAWGTLQSHDPQYGLRAGLIAFGLAVSIASFLCVVATVLANPGHRSLIVLSGAFTLSIFSLGWKNFPYWINGVYQAYIRGQGADFDPKALIPMTWIGEVWRFGVLLLYPAVFLGLIFSLFFAVKIRSWSLSLSIMTLFLLNLFCFLGPLNYLTWLMD
jgi:hypothetical protein